MVPAALLEDLIVILMVHVRRPSDRQHPRVAFANEFSISMPLDVVSRINEPHLSGQHLGCGPRQTLKVDSLDITGLRLHSARPMVLYTRYVDATSRDTVDFEVVSSPWPGPSRAHNIHQVPWDGYGSDPDECWYA